jgi:hypothetical protein
VIVCKECGHRNEDGDDFCGSCGAFLEFSGERAAAEPEPAAPEPAPEPGDEPRPTLLDRVRSAVGMADDPGAPAGAEPVDGGGDTIAAADGGGDPLGGLGDPLDPSGAGEAAPEADGALDRGTVADAAPGREAREGSEPVADATATRTATGAVPPAPEAGEAGGRVQEPARGAEAAGREARAGADEAGEGSGEAGPGAGEAERAARLAALVARAATSEPVAPADGSGPPPPAGGEEGRAPEVGAARRPEAVKPGRTRVRRPAPVTSPAEVLNPGDLVCGQCGAGNDPTRRFCRRCGTSLVVAAVVPRPPWYRRLFHRRPRAKPEAGSRPGPAGSGRRDQSLATRGRYAFLKARSTAGKVGRILALLAVLGVAGLSLGPWREAAGDLFHRVERVVSPDYEAVRPAAVAATSELGDHPARAVIDQVSNSYWAEGAAGTGAGQGLTFTFDGPVDLDRVGFLNGASAEPEDFVTQPRLREVQLLFDDGTTASITLKDDADFQQHGIGAKGVTTVQLQIVSVYPSLDGSAASLAEVEFFRKE